MENNVFKVGPEVEEIVSISGEVLVAIARERRNQIEKGHTSESDDRNIGSDWLAWIAGQIAKGKFNCEAIVKLDPEQDQLGKLVGAEINDRLVSIAALAIAALESRYRRQAAIREVQS